MHVEIPVKLDIKLEKLKPAKPSERRSDEKEGEVGDRVEVRLAEEVEVGRLVGDADAEVPKENVPEENAHAKSAERKGRKEPRIRARRGPQDPDLNRTTMSEVRGYELRAACHMLL